MAGYIFPFEKLDVYQLAVDLAENVLKLLEKLPQNKHIRLSGYPLDRTIHPVLWLRTVLETSAPQWIWKHFGSLSSEGLYQSGFLVRCSE